MRTNSRPISSSTGHRQRADAGQAHGADPAGDAGQHLRQAAHVGQAAGGVGAGGAQQDVVRLVAAQHVVDQVRVDGHLAARAVGAGLAAVDQPGDHRDVAEGAAQQAALGHPGLQVVAQHVLLEQGVDVAAARWRTTRR